jgi:hypothetical protein
VVMGYSGFFDGQLKGSSRVFISSPFRSWYCINSLPFSLAKSFKSDPCCAVDRGITPFPMLTAWD